MAALLPQPFVVPLQVGRAQSSTRLLLKRRPFYPRFSAAANPKNGVQSPKSPVVVIVPGWLSESAQYRQMASYLCSKGVPAMIVPLKWFNWIPSLGGRSVRPILDRINATITRALTDDEDGILEALDDDVEYTFFDFFKEFINPKKGAQPPKEPLSMKEVATFSDQSTQKIVLVAHSAGGWICRILLGAKVPYDGCTYAASRNVRALVTLGTPHVCTDKLTKRNMDFVNENYPGAAEAERGVNYICLAGKFVQGESQYWGLWKDFAWQSYELCCGRGDVWGDGVIPLDCAVGLEGAQHVIIEGVEHFPSIRDKQNRKWYGSPEIIDKWLPLVDLLSQERESTVVSQSTILTL